MTDNFDEEMEAALDSVKMDSAKSDIENLPDSPNSANIKVWINGFGVMFTMRDNKMKNVVNKIETLIQIAQEKGWKNVWDSPTPVKPTIVATGATTGGQGQGSTQVCGIHNISMVWKSGISKKTGKPYAFWSCPSPAVNGIYCSFKV